MNRNDLVIIRLSLESQPLFRGIERSEQGNGGKF